jgi:SEC-C motif-containing protein
LLLRDNPRRSIIFEVDQKESTMDTCPCGSNVAYDACCRPLIKGEQPATTAEQLMRSRYSAFVKKELEYIYTSLHPDSRADYNEKSSRDWAETATWHSFKIVETKGGKAEDREGKVEFIVTYSQNNVKTEHHELSTFKKEGDTWYFATGKNMPKQPVNVVPKIGRNDPCLCGSGKKSKKCCGK